MSWLIVFWFIILAIVLFKANPEIQD